MKKSFYAVNARFGLIKFNTAKDRNYYVENVENTNKIMVKDAKREYPNQYRYLASL